MRALVTDAQLRTAVAGIRGLGRGGVEVVALGPDASAAGLRSRYTRSAEQGPDVLADPAGFRAAVVRVASLHGPVVLYPCQEASLEAAFDLAGASQDVLLPWPSRDAVDRLRDKAGLPQAARAAGIATPRVHYAGPAGGVPAAGVPLPALVKAARPSASLPRPIRVEDEAALRDLPDGEVVVQEIGSGPLEALVLLLAPGGEVVAALQQRAVRTWPAEAGPSALAVTVPLEHDLVEQARSLLAAWDYWGLAELQFVSTPDGRALIDVNTRFYGSMPLALRAGVNFPALWHAVAQGRRPDAPGGYTVGASFRWVEADLAEAARGRFAPMAERGPQPRTGAFWAPDDPVPAVLLAADAVRSRAARRVPAAGASIASVRALRAIAGRQSVLLSYHGLGTPGQPGDDHFLMVSPDRFRRQVELLLDAGFRFETVAGIAARLPADGGGPPPPGLASLSFDDGMHDNHEVLLPLLEEYRIPATVYVTTGAIGQPNPWLAGERMMTEDELRDLAAAGVELGAHTVTHPDLSALGYDDCLREMTESRDEVERIAGTRAETFAYPFCKYGPAAVEAARDAGFAAAVTCIGRGSWNRYELKRQMVTGKDGLPSFVLKVAGAYQPLFDSAPGRAVRVSTRGLRARLRGRA